MNSQARLVGSFVLSYQEFLCSSNADTFDSSKMRDMSHILHKLLTQIMVKCTNLTSTYHKIKKKYYICILYDMLRLWQRVQWGQNYPESWNKKCK